MLVHLLPFLLFTPSLVTTKSTWVMKVAPRGFHSFYVREFSSGFSWKWQLWENCSHWLKSEPTSNSLLNAFFNHSELQTRCLQTSGSSSFTAHTCYSDTYKIRLKWMCMALIVFFSHCRHVLIVPYRTCEQQKPSTAVQHILTHLQSAKSLALNDVYLIAP